MIPNDFKVLSTLPEGYDYELFNQLNDDILVVGKQHQTIIGFILRKGELHQQIFQSTEDKQCKI